jgi:hypothetical protein
VEMARKYLSLMILLIMGCSMVMGCSMIKNEYVQSVSGHYETVVFDDGISLEEAKIIAQKQLIKMNVIEIYFLSKPQVFRNAAELPNYQEYWFIFFEEKVPSNIPFIFMVIINKENGSIKFSDDYAEESQWILEAALLR